MIKVRSLTFFLLLTLISSNLLSQNQHYADSLISILNQGNLTKKERLNFFYLIGSKSTNPNDVIDYSSKLIIEAQEINDHENLILGYINLGYGHKLKGNLSIALNSYLTAAEIATKNNDPVAEGDAYTNVASLYTSNEDYDKSLLYYNKVIELYKNNVDSARLAGVYINYGYATYKAELYDSSINQLKKAIYFAQFTSYNGYMAYAQSNMALSLAKINRFDEAEKQLNEALQIMEANNDNYALSDCLVEIGGIYVEKGDLDKAIEKLEKGYNIALSNGLKEQLQNGAKFLSVAYTRQGDFKIALNYQSIYYNYRDSLINAVQIRELADLRTEYEVGQKQVEVDLLKEKQKGFFFAVFFLIILLILIGTLAYVFIIRNREKHAANLLLTKQTIELEALNSTKDRFFSIISHDLRSPVSAFKGLSTLIRFSVEQKRYDDLPEITERITNASDKLSMLLDNLLEWAINQQGQMLYTPEKIALMELIEVNIQVFQNMAIAKNIKIEVEVKEEVNIWAEINSVMTIFRNLINNALKFTESGGTITISVLTIQDFAQLKVADTGVGISEDKIGSLFLLKEKKNTWGTEGEKGLGLGLRLAHEFAEMNKGSVSVESEEGVGSTFTVNIPLFTEV